MLWSMTWSTHLCLEISLMSYNVWTYDSFENVTFEVFIDSRNNCNKVVYEYYKIFSKSHFVIKVFPKLPLWATQGLLTLPLILDFAFSLRLFQLSWGRVYHMTLGRKGLMVELPQSDHWSVVDPWQTCGWPLPAFYHRSAMCLPWFLVWLW